MHWKNFSLFIILILALTACVRPGTNAPVWTPAASGTGTPAALFLTIVPPAISTQLPPTRVPGAEIGTPTPDAWRTIPTITVAEAEVLTQYIVQPGDYLGAIAANLGFTVDELMAANGLTDPNTLEVGQVLALPVTPQAQPSAFEGSGFKIIPDSELVYGPFAGTLDVPAFVSQKGGYLTFYTENLNGEDLTGAEIVEKVAREYSVNPRLLLAILEYRSQWVTNPNPSPATMESPLGYIDAFHVGLYRQLTWTADNLNYGFYQWHEQHLTRIELKDGSQVWLNGGINAGTAGVQNFFATVADTSTWKTDVGPNGVFATYQSLFGYPFDFAIEPILPEGLSQPPMSLPFDTGETWNFTGGPHGGWDSGSAWAALDFAPPGESLGCDPRDEWTLAVADGTIIRTGDGQVIQDLDNDGYEQTGWTILYLHIEERGRVAEGTFVRAGDRIGHPSCEGGYSVAAHLHLARRYNGMWVGADTSIPFNLEGWVSSGAVNQYDGFLTRNGVIIEAWDNFTPANQITR